MAKIPTYVSDANPAVPLPDFQRKYAAEGAGLGSLGHSIGNAGHHVGHAVATERDRQLDIAEATKRQNIAISQLEARKLEQKMKLEVTEKTSQLRTDWNMRLIEYQQNPELATLDNASKEYDDYTSKMVNEAGYDVVKQELALSAASLRIDFINHVYAIQSQHQLQKFGATFDKMMSNAEDSIFANKTLTELAIHQDLLNKTVDDAVETGQIKNPEVAQNLRDKVNLLGVAWAESVMSTNPEMVQAAISEGVLEGVSAHQKYILLEKASEVARTKDSQYKVLLKDALKSDIIQRVETGEGSSLNLDEYERQFGKEERSLAERKLNDATKLHRATESSKGASGDTLIRLQESYKPQANPTSPEYGHQAELYDDVQKVIKHALNDRATNTFNYYASHPSVKDLDLRLVGEETPESRKILQEAVLEQQKLDESLPSYQYQIMPTGEAESFIENFNKMVEVGGKGDSGGVLQLLNSFHERFDKNMHVAVNQINETKGGDKVTSKMNPLLWHLRNPSTFRLIVDAIRKDPQEVNARFKSEKELKNFMADVRTDPGLMSYQSSVLGANNGAEAQRLVTGVNEAYTAFTKDWVLNGGRMKDAASVFFAPYTFGTVNGATYARPINYADASGKPHTMSEDQINLSNGYLEWFPKRLDPSTIDPATVVNTIGYFTSEQITQDVKNALSSNAFWSTTEDETGVYMFVKGSIFGAPKQVFYKNGKPVRVNFADTMVSVPKVPFGEKPQHYQEETGDSALDRVANMLLRSH